MTAVLTEREVILDFLEMYKSFTCLWDITCKQYSNRDARNQALELLKEKLKIIDNDASISTVKKKIENMRAAYKREFKKVQDSKRTGAGLKDIYVPSLWYFEYLTFLNEKENTSISGIDTIDFSGDDEVSETQSIVNESSTTLGKKRRGTKLQQQQQTLIESAQHLMSKVDSPEDIYGKNIGMQLAEMTKTQKCIAEKLISEVIFYGKLEKLTLCSSISLSGYDNSYNYSTPSPSSTMLSLHSDTSHISPVTTMPYNSSTPSPSSTMISLHSDTSQTSPVTTMPIPTSNEVPNDPNNIQHSYNVNEFLLFKHL
ncbi:uncharacterized protein LOC112592799 [Melanaphis sacchari]|uniref:uncharacterized protein LOC112592799 n=2 Tax=Aphidinae TaxID=133076 RepID=UPI000B934805|nr:uncharacterized protein LOC111039445 isoform X1 [Myzus persicae]XP_025192733.1 uncharacterized protein LOC112592799 [Melanaphis sacchari]